MSVLRDNGKVDGEWSEMVFQCEATRRGFILSKPFGDNQAYDFLLDNGSGIVRVQVKSTNVCLSNGGDSRRYRIDMYHGRDRALYTQEEIDVFAAFIIPENAWYFIPVEEVTGNPRVSFYPHLPDSKGKFEPYKNYWELFDHYEGI